MLTPSYLNSFASEYLGMVDLLNEEITRDIARRITKTGKVTKTAEWQAKMAQEQGKLMDDIISDVSTFTGYSEPTVKTMFVDAGLTSINYDAKPLVDAGIITEARISDNASKVLLANAYKTSGDITRLTMTTASTGQDLFVQSCNEALLKVQSGAYTPEEAIRDAVKKAAVIGNYVLYDSGHKLSLDSAIRMNLTTSVNQTCGKITEMNATELGCEYYETSAHAGARPEHSEWQGKVFKINGSDAEHENFYEATGYGDILGLCGVNCRHSFYPFFPELSKPAYSEEKLQEYSTEQYSYNGNLISSYEASQIQRKMENSIRQSKRLLAGYDGIISELTDKEEIARAKQLFNEESVRLKKKEKKLKIFANQTNRTIDNKRMQVHATVNSRGKIVNYGKSSSQKAVWANKKAQLKSVTKGFKVDSQIVIPSDYSDVGLITPEIESEISNAIKKLESEYKILLDVVITDDIAKKGVIFATGYTEEGITAMVINTNHDFITSDKNLLYNYEMGKYTGKSWEDYIAHEMAHVMIVQDGINAKEMDILYYEAADAGLLLSKTGSYADEMPDLTKRGIEKMSEMFVKYRNNEPITDLDRLIMNKYFGRYKK